MKTLEKIPLKQRTRILNIMESSLKPKLIEMGLYSGKEVEVLYKAPFGDPIAVDINGYTLSMRLSEAALIEVE